MNWKKQPYADAFTNQRILVTGGAGFIGSHIIQALTQLNADVVAIDDLTGGDWANLTGFDNNVKKITASILDTDAINHATNKCRFVFHQAALGSVPASLEKPMRFHQVNVIGTINVLQAARNAGTQRVLYAGSSSAYGDPPTPGPKIESMPPLPRSPYAATKLAAEHAMRAWSHSYGLDTAVLRYFNIFGPRQNANSAYAAAIAAFATALLQGQSPTIFGSGQQSRDFTFVHNAVHANLLAATCPTPLQGNVFNIGCHRSVSINDLYNNIAQLAKHPDIKPTYKPMRTGDVMDSLADINAAQNTLGYSPIVDFETGLAITVDWYRDSQQH